MADNKMVSRNLAQALIQHGMPHHFLGSIIGAVAGSALGGIFGHNNYEAQLAPITTTDYKGAIQGGLSQEMQGYNQAQQQRQSQMDLQNILLDQYLGGTGPSVAENMLNKQTGQNIQAQRALMASQRGVGQNAGLIAKEAAMQGGQLQQQASADAAILRAQEQIAARQALQNQQGMIAGQDLSQQQLGGALFGTGAQAQNAQNNSQIENYRQQQGINANISKANTQNTKEMFSNLGGGLSSIPFLKKFQGGEIPKHIEKVASILYPDVNSPHEIPGRIGTPGKDSEEYDRVLVMESPGEVTLPRSVTQSSNPPKKAEIFMRELMAKKERKDYRRVAQAKKYRGGKV